MPLLERGSARIHYEEAGDPSGPPVLLLAPGGLRSRIEAWDKLPWALPDALDLFHLILMDQRNAGRSIAPITADDGWASYTGDQLALLDHLGITRCAVMGMCIGGPFIVRLLRAAPWRFRAAVMLQPIGLEQDGEGGDNRGAFHALFEAWAKEMGPLHPEATPEVFSTFRDRMFGGEFMFGATRADATGCDIPILLGLGDDVYHPRTISEAFAELAPRVQVMTSWKDRPTETAETIRNFLTEAR